MTKPELGFIGLGIMGKPMARNLLAAGYSLCVHNRSPQSMDELRELGAETAGTPAEVAAACDILITMLPNSPDVELVIAGRNGVLEGARPGLIVIDMSSIAPSAAQSLAEKCLARQVTLLDAPVSGGEPKAIDGTLAIMVGGPEDTFETIKPVLLEMGASAVRVGEVGAGNIAKLANQIIVGINIAAMSEALVLARKAGADPRKVFDAIRGGLAGSTVLEAKGPMALEGNFKPGFRMELHLKDLTNARDTASQTGAPLPLATEVLAMMQDLCTRGDNANDHSGLVRYFEDLAGVTLKSGT